MSERDELECLRAMMMVKIDTNPTEADFKRWCGLLSEALALNARQSDTISGLTAENQALRQGVVCYVLGRLNAASLGLWHVVASRNEAGFVDHFNAEMNGCTSDVHVNIFQTKPMATYELALQEAARVYERDFWSIAERLPMHHKGEPYQG